jgi:hypothetical protein
LKSDGEESALGVSDAPTRCARTCLVESAVPEVTEDLIVELNGTFQLGDGEI